MQSHPYQITPVKLKFLREEVEYMMVNGIMPSSSQYIVLKSNGGYRFCTDFQNFNAVTKSGSYLIPRVEGYMNRIGVAKLVSKFDLLKGYW